MTEVLQFAQKLRHFSPFEISKNLQIKQIKLFFRYKWLLILTIKWPLTAYCNLFRMNVRPLIFGRKLVVLTTVGGSKKVRSSDSVNVANEARHISVSRSPALLSTRQDQACSGFKFQPFRFDEIIYQPCSIRIRYILHDQRRPTGNWIWNYNLDRMMISGLVCCSTVL